jgi:menaquinol-cytochrome c reductase iron-sulfur subunit
MSEARRSDAERTAGPTRRGALLTLGIALNAVVATLLAIPLVGFVLSPARRWSWQQWVSLGPLTDYPENQTRLATYRNPFSRPWDGDTANIPCWVRRVSGEEFHVFAINCTHLGCPVRWFPASGLFMCPCHGGVFYSDGKHASGPPPRPLYQYDHKVESGQLWVRGGQIPTLSESV